MPTISTSIKIQMPVEEVFAYVTDPMNIPEWMVGMIEVTDVRVSASVITGNTT